MSRFREIFSRKPDSMSRFMKWFFGLPLSYSFYLLISLFVPSFGSSNNAFLLRYAFLELILCFSVLFTVKRILGFSVSKLICPNRGFSFSLFIRSFAFAFLSFSATSFLWLMLASDDFEFSFVKEGFLLSWFCAFFLIVIASFTEELIFRCYIAFSVNDELEKRPQKILIYSLFSAFLFAVFHFENPEVSGSGAVWSMLFYFIFGFSLMVFSLSLGSFEVAFGSHIANNLVSSVLFSYDNSVIRSDALFTHHNNIGPIMIIQTILCLLVLALFVRKEKHNRQSLRH